VAGSQGGGSPVPGETAVQRESRRFSASALLAGLVDCCVHVVVAANQIESLSQLCKVSCKGGIRKNTAHQKYNARDGVS